MTALSAGHHLWKAATALLAVAMIALSGAPARASNATDAAACMALVGGPAGTAAAALANGNGLKPLEQMFGDAKKAAQAAGRFAAKGCAAHTEDPVFIAVTSAITAMVLSGKLPNDYDTASKTIEKLIGEIVGKLVQAALENSASPLHYIADALPSGFMDQLNQYIKDQATNEIIDLLNSNPVTKQFLDYFDCGVVVATSGIKDQVQHMIDLAKQTKQNAHDCADFLKTCVGSPVDCLTGMAELGVAIAKGVANLPGELLKDVLVVGKEAKQAVLTIASSPAAAGEYVQCHLTGAMCSATPGPQQEFCSVVFQCNPGDSYEACAAKLTSQVPTGCSYFDYQCKGGVQTIKLSSGKQFCGCPAGQGIVMNDYYSTCAPCTGDGKVLDGGFCKTWTCAASKPGMKLVGYGKEFGRCNYEHLCQGAQVWDSKTNSCTHCPDNTVFAGYSTGTGNNVIQNSGVCRSCAYDESLKYIPGTGGGFKVSAQGSVSLDLLTCQKLQCEGLSHPDKNRPHECVACKAVFDPTAKQYASLGTKFGSKPVCLDADFDGKPPCPSGQVPVPGGHCITPPKAAEPGATKLRKPGSGPYERVVNPGDQVTKDKGKGKAVNPATTAPSLDGIGSGGFGTGSSAPAIQGGGLRTYSPGGYSAKP